MSILKQNNQDDIFEEKVNFFIEQNYVKNQSLKLLNSSDNWTYKMNEYNFEVWWEEVINALLAYDKTILNILYFETTNWKNKNNQTSKNIQLPWAWRFSIHNFILIAREKWLKQITFDIMESELNFYEIILDELEKSNLIQKVYFISNIGKKKFIIDLQ